MTGSELDLTVNGEPRRVPPATTVADLLTELGVDARQVAGERNRVIVAKTDYADTELGAGDVLEIVTFVGGG